MIFFHATHVRFLDAADRTTDRKTPDSAVQMSNILPFLGNTFTKTHQHQDKTCIRVKPVLGRRPMLLTNATSRTFTGICWRL